MRIFWETGENWSLHVVKIAANPWLKKTIFGCYSEGPNAMISYRLCD